MEDGGETDPSPDANIKFLTKLTDQLIKGTRGAWSIRDIDETDLESFFEYLFFQQQEELSTQLFI